MMAVLVVRWGVEQATQSSPSCRPTSEPPLPSSSSVAVHSTVSSSNRRHPDLFLYCCDFAESAVQIVKVGLLSHTGLWSVITIMWSMFFQDHPLFDPSRCHVFQCDITSDPLPFSPGSVDLAILIFVLSAIQPSQWVTQGKYNNNIVVELLYCCS